MIKQFSQVNKKAARVSNCCRAAVTIEGDTTHFHRCKACNMACDTISFYEQLTENLSNLLLGEKLPLDIIQAESGELIIPARRKITKTLIKSMAANYDRIDIDPSPIRNKVREYIVRTCINFGVEF